MAPRGKRREACMAAKIDSRLCHKVLFEGWPPLCFADAAAHSVLCCGLYYVIDKERQVGDDLVDDHYGRRSERYVQQGGVPETPLTGSKDEPAANPAY